MAELCLREFGMLVQGVSREDSLDVCGVASPRAWEFFENLAFSDAKDNRFIETAQFEGRKALRVKNFVGVISAPDGTQVEILPKTSEEGQDCESTRALLWKMLCSVEGLRFLETTEADLKLRSMPLIESLVAFFLEHVAALVRRGIRRDYERVEDEERFLRGRLRVVQQLQLPPGRQHMFRIEYDLFSENRAENRLIHSALAKVARTSCSVHNQRLARELRHGFEPVPISVDFQSDFQKWRTGRDMAHYQALLPWVRLILNQQCPTSLKDEHAGISLLFAIEKLFEKYVAQVLQRRLTVRGISVQTQQRSAYLSEEPQAFLLKPDLVLSRGGRRLSVMDTKWKLIDKGAVYDSGRSDPKAGIAQSDMYQLFAYGHKYLGGAGRLFLIYPKWSGFDTPLLPFRLGERLFLDVVPFDLARDTCPLIDILLSEAGERDPLTASELG
jgi:5-methylcytosine-specific restriction enzyme subunit McrC